MNEKELRALYDARLREDFPPDELRPLANMLDLMADGLYRCYRAVEEDRPLGYALCTVDHGAALLDYFAVEPDLRGQGIGGRFLRELKDLDFGADFLLIEAESLPAAADEAQTQERTRRLNFYHRCGCLSCGVFSHLFGVEFEILVLPLTEHAVPTAGQVKASLEGLYRAMLLGRLAEDEQELARLARVFLRPDPEEGASRTFARDLGLAVTFLTRNRSRFMGERLKEYGFSGAMYNILLYVDRHPGATQDAIATHMYIDKSNVARRIRQLEDLGYVRRETDPADRRQNNLTLTETGAALAPVIRSYLGEWSNTIAADLTPEERTTLLSLLQKMLQQ